jgi:hypothetical protein
MALVRFVAVFHEAGAVTALVLGHGYKDQGGAPHSSLADRYLKESELGKENYIYAGYVSVTEKDEVALSEGGSESMRISNDPKRNEFIRAYLESNKESIKAFALLVHERKTKIRM